MKILISEVDGVYLLIDINTNNQLHLKNFDNVLDFLKQYKSITAGNEFHEYNDHCDASSIYNEWLTYSFDEKIRFVIEAYNNGYFSIEKPFSASFLFGLIHGVVKVFHEKPSMFFIIITSIFAFLVFIVSNIIDLIVSFF